MDARLITVVASHPHYADHIAPVAALLPSGGDVALVAGYGDVVNARRSGFRRIVLMQHGVGQSFSNDHSHYPGGRGNEAVGLFLTPNEHSADRWRRAYPESSVVTVGSPRAEALPARVPGGGPVVAIAFHFDLYMTPETRSALAWYRDELHDLAGSFTMIGTGHPRRTDMEHVYAKAGIEYVPDFEEVCRRADVLAFDATSVGYEFAFTGRPVVVMNAPWYRTEAKHGLRFWDAAHVGPRVDTPSALGPAIERALAGKPVDVADREDALAQVFAYRDGSAQRAADAIREWAA